MPVARCQCKRSGQGPVARGQVPVRRMAPSAHLHGSTSDWEQSPRKIRPPGKRARPSVSPSASRQRVNHVRNVLADEIGVFRLFRAALKGVCGERDGKHRYADRPHTIPMRLQSQSFSFALRQNARKGDIPNLYTFAPICALSRFLKHVESHLKWSVSHSQGISHRGLATSTRM